MTDQLAIILTSIIVGMVTYGVSTIVTIEAGPFAIFDRIREALLPEDTVAIADGFMIPTPDDWPNDWPDVPGNAGDGDKMTPEQAQKANGITPEQAQKAFDKTVTGTIHGIFDCAVCFGVWFSAPVAALTVILGLVAWDYSAIVWLAGFAFHRFLLGAIGDI